MKDILDFFVKTKCGYALTKKSRYYLKALLIDYCSSGPATAIEACLDSILDKPPRPSRYVRLGDVDRRHAVHHVIFGALQLQILCSAMDALTDPLFIRMPAIFVSK